MRGGTSGFKLLLVSFAISISSLTLRAGSCQKLSAATTKYLAPGFLEDMKKQEHSDPCSISWLHRRHRSNSTEFGRIRCTIITWVIHWKCCSCIPMVKARQKSLVQIEQKA